MLEFLQAVGLPYVLALASAGLPVAALVGLAGYRELQVRLGRLPAATERDDLETELDLMRRRREELLRELGELEGRRGVVEALRVEAETWQERIRQLEVQWEALADRRREIAAVESELAGVLERLEAERAQEAELRARAEELTRRVEGLEREEAGARERLQAVQADLEARRAEASEVHRLLEAGRQEVARLGAEVARQRERLAESERALKEADERLQATERRLADLQREREELEERCRRLYRETADLEQRRAELRHITGERERIVREIDALRADHRRLEAERTALEQRIEAAKGELAAVREQVERAFENLQVVVKEAEARGDEIDVLAEFRNRPGCFAQAKARETLSENRALEILEDHLDQRGLSYPKRVLEAFHTCLKIADISPLTVLAGISGTGKSALPREYADALGLDFLVVPVQPRWDSPQDLLGFYNYVEERFKATELSRALVRFDRENWPDIAEKDGIDVSKRMLIVLLDEMNLARVEYYFSDFLSLLEVRRDSPERAVVSVDLGHGRARQLKLTENVLYVGTMNEDESTQSLSDKVLDRANVIRFTRPRRLRTVVGATSAQPQPRLSRGIWESWRTPPRDAEIEELEGKVGELNAVLERIGRPFGHRLFQAICFYHANHPRTRRGEPEAWKTTLADQLEFRILPRLRGLETDRHAAGLDELQGFLRELEDEALARAFEQAREAEFFFWPGAVRDEQA